MPPCLSMVVVTLSSGVSVAQESLPVGAATWCRLFPTHVGVNQRIVRD